MFAAANFAAADVFGPDMLVADLLVGATFDVDMVKILGGSRSIRNNKNNAINRVGKDGARRENTGAAIKLDEA